MSGYALLKRKLVHFLTVFFTCVFHTIFYGKEEIPKELSIACKHVAALLTDLT